MLATYTSDALTVLSFEEARDAVRWALKAQTGTLPMTDVLALALAKTALETGRWTKIHRYNFGNVKAGETYSGQYTCFACGENLADGEHWFEPDGMDRNKRTGVVTGQGTLAVPPGHPQTRFRAYANEFDGAGAYVSFVAGGRYAQAWLRLLAGDAAGYVHALKLAGYFTAPEEPYRAGVVSLQREFLGKLRGETPEPADVDHTSAMACTADGLRLFTLDQWLATLEPDLESPAENLNELSREEADTDPAPPPSEEEPNT
jgi:hypothetical protein